jgi:hypothetical protein
MGLFCQRAVQQGLDRPCCVNRRRHTCVVTWSRSHVLLDSPLVFTSRLVYCWATAVVLAETAGFYVISTDVVYRWVYCCCSGGDSRVLWDSSRSGVLVVRLLCTTSPATCSGCSLLVDILLRSWQIHLRASYPLPPTDTIQPLPSI